VEPDRTRACIAIAVAWCALAVVFGAYAIRNTAVGPLLLALVSLWCLRLAWLAAWETTEPEDDPERR
jgi:steroid 5-alpha reductase family enzyme